MGRLDGKTALVTGGGNGIGRACAFAFAREGANLLLVDIRHDAAEAAAEEVVESGGSAVAVACDVSDADAVDAAVSAGLGRFGRIDVLLNSAGGGSVRDGPVTELDPEEFWRTIRVDLYGTLLMCRRVIPEMVRSGGGSIINMSSLRAVIGTRGADAYTAAKGGVLSVSRAMAMQWAEKGIRINALAPGVTLTERVAEFIASDDPICEKSLLGLSRPDDVAELALFLASDESSRITGTTMRIDGGASAH